MDFEAGQGGQSTEERPDNLVASRINSSTCQLDKFKCIYTNIDGLSSDKVQNICTIHSN